MQGQIYTRSFVLPCLFIPVHCRHPFFQPQHRQSTIVIPISREDPYLTGSTSFPWICLISIDGFTSMPRRLQQLFGRGTDAPASVSASAEQSRPDSPPPAYEEVDSHPRCGPQGIPTNLSYPAPQTSGWPSLAASPTQLEGKDSVMSPTKDKKEDQYSLEGSYHADSSVSSDFQRSQGRQLISASMVGQPAIKPRHYPIGQSLIAHQEGAGSSRQCPSHGVHHHHSISPGAGNTNGTHWRFGQGDSVYSRECCLPDTHNGDRSVCTRALPCTLDGCDFCGAHSGKDCGAGVGNGCSCVGRFE